MQPKWHPQKIRKHWCPKIHFPVVKYNKEMELNQGGKTFSMVLSMQVTQTLVKTKKLIESNIAHAYCGSISCDKTTCYMLTKTGITTVETNAALEMKER